MIATLLTRPRSLGAFAVVYWLDVFTRNEYKTFYLTLYVIVSRRKWRVE